MSIDIIDLLEEGAERTVARNGLILLGIAIALAISQALALVVWFGVSTTLGVLGFLVVAVLGVVFFVGAARTFASEETETLPRENFTRNLGWAVLNLIVGWIAFGIVVGVGLIALVVPGLFLLVSLFFWNVHVVVEDEDVLEGFRYSWSLTEDHRLQLFGLGVVVTVIATVIPTIANVIPFVGVVLAPVGLVFFYATAARTYVRLTELEGGAAGTVVDDTDAGTPGPGAPDDGDPTTLGPTGLTSGGRGSPSKEPTQSSDGSTSLSDAPVFSSERSVSISDDPVVPSDEPATSSDEPPVIGDEPVTSVDGPTVPPGGAATLTEGTEAPTSLTEEQELDAPTDEPVTSSEETATPPGEPATRSPPSEPAVSTGPRLGPPEAIPRVSDIAIEYDELVDERPIGSGGNADVTRATYPTPDGDLTLAIKRPRISDTLDMKAIEGMLVEAEMWEKLDDHDHIVGVIDYGSEPLPWIAMEFMDGGHLREWAGRMDVPQALWTSIAITEGVRHAHRRGVAHLDLKPENILFRTVEGAWDVPKVADWGLSKLLLEHSRSIEGISPQYSAPEQFDPEYGRADDITDIYQLGAVLYELFAGRAPFEGPPTQVMRAVLDDEPRPPSEVAPDVPEALDEVILTALAKEKRDRFDNVAYLRDALQDLYDEWE